MRKFGIILMCFYIGFIHISCQDDLDDTIVPADVLQLKGFVWRAMNIFYLNKSEVADLANDRFANTNEFNAYLSDFSSPENLFSNLTTTTDRFSIIVDDYRALENALNGIRVDNGMRFGLVRLSETNDVFGYVRYVLPNSPADQANVERGMLFNKINGVRLTPDTNFSALFNQNNYTISLAELTADGLDDTSTEIALNKIQLIEQAIHHTEILENNGTKVGYLMYNGFRRTQEEELNAVFGNFVSEGIEELVLDLRYNGGGDLRTSVDLAGMITGQFSGELFATQELNANFDTEEIFFTSQNRAGESLNSLNLNRVYILTSPSTASASEVLSSGLLPYINVVQIGTFTVGKYQGSITVYDSEDFRRQGATLSHTYALQPLVFKIVNSAGFTDFDEGLAPTILQQENFTNLGVLGNDQEPLLKTALEDIGFVFGRPAPKSKTPAYGELLMDDNQNEIDYQRTYVNFGSESYLHFKNN